MSMSGRTNFGVPFGAGTEYTAEHLALVRQPVWPGQSLKRDYLDREPPQREVD